MISRRAHSHDYSISCHGAVLRLQQHSMLFSAMHVLHAHNSTALDTWQGLHREIAEPVILADITVLWVASAVAAVRAVGAAPGAHAAPDASTDRAAGVFGRAGPVEHRRTRHSSGLLQGWLLAQ